MHRRLALPALLALLVVGLLAGSAFAARTQDATATIDLEDNKALARRFHGEIFNEGNLAVADEIVAPDFVWHYPGMTDEGAYDPNRITAIGPEEVKQQAEDIRAFYSDLVLTDEDEIAEGDRVVIRWSLTGTAQVEAGGVPVTVTGIDIFRITDGQLAELWQHFDELGLNQQLEEIPATPRTGTPTS